MVHAELVEGWRNMTLTEFLLARIAEDEAAARNAVDDGEHWLHLGGGEIVQGDAGMTVSSGWLRLPHRFEAADHIALHDPARVLAECEANRRIVELHKAVVGGGVDDCGFQCRNVRCPTLALVALPYVDHPDYRDEWRP